MYQKLFYSIKVTPWQVSQYLFSLSFIDFCLSFMYLNKNSFLNQQVYILFVMDLHIFALWYKRFHTKIVSILGNNFVRLSEIRSKKNNQPWSSNFESILHTGLTTSDSNQKKHYEQGLMITKPLISFLEVNQCEGQQCI